MNWRNLLKLNRRKVLLALVLFVPSYFLVRYVPVLNYPALVIYFGSVGLAIKLADAVGGLPFGASILAQPMTLLYVFSVSYLLSCIVIFMVGKIREQK